MLSLKLRSFFNRQFRSSVTNITRRLVLPVASNIAQNVSKDNDCLVIKWKDRKVDEFPYVYLRENCRCPSCYTDPRKSRTIFSPKEVDINITAESAIWNTNDDRLEVKWQDGHISHYSYDWLKYLRFV